MERSLQEAKTLARQVLGSMRGFQGIGLGEDYLRVYTEDTETAALLPRLFEGFRVEAVVTGELLGHGNPIASEELR